MKSFILSLLPVAVLLSTVSTSVAAEETMGRVTGRIGCPDSHDCRGLAVLWEKDAATVPDPRRFTVPPGIVSPLQADGLIALEAPPGEYYVGAFLRNSRGPMMGPPRVGDLIYLTPNPAGEPNEVRVEAGKTADAGTHSKSWRFTGMTDPAETGVGGQILDTKGKPVAGLLVFAFADADLSLNPLAVSTRSDDDGQFLLPLAKPGTVYLRVRKSYRGGQPLPGDYVGVYGGAVPKPLPVAENKFIKGLRIQVLQIPELMKRKNAPNTSRPQIRQ